MFIIYLTNWTLCKPKSYPRARPSCFQHTSEKKLRYFCFTVIFDLRIKNNKEDDDLSKYILKEYLPF